ncbi:MAG: hypothetical protein K6F92_07655 [Lachnospiraceae bacterium]|nr:hypothetical protein [Lachnospiraceae bacterium]
MDFDQCIEKLERLTSKLEDEDATTIEEFIEALHDVNSMDELDEYTDLLLGIADNLDVDDQDVIYQIIRYIQE